jgi:hypothetical protein
MIYQFPELFDLKTYDLLKCKTRINKSEPMIRLDVAAAILVAEGNYTQMSVLLGRSRTLIQNFVVHDEELAMLRQEVFDIKIDQIEQNTLDRALQGEDAVSERFILTTLGANRGYGTKPITINSAMVTEDDTEIKIVLVPKGQKIDGEAMEASE